MNDENTITISETMEFMERLLLGETFYVDPAQEPYKSIISEGYANIIEGIISKNWRTELWKASPATAYVGPKPEPITSRYEILDL